MWKGILFFSFGLLACQENAKSPAKDAQEKPVDVIQEYLELHPDNGKASISQGTEANGSLINGKLFPFSGTNFKYFDTGSYLAGRAFCNDAVLKTMQQAYQILEHAQPERIYRVMECSHEKGGRLFPHRTHQNGMSVDLMIPLQKDGKPYYGLDDKGKGHYFLDFDQQGRWTKDSSVRIDFDLLCTYILCMNKGAMGNRLKIKKVILSTHLHDELFSSKHGFRLKENGIYFAQQLEKQINDLHDDHIHVDFEPL